MVSLTLSKNAVVPPSGLRPVNLKTDLGPLADLIELAFADSMDSSGRAAVREMRTLSRLSFGMGVFGGMNELIQGIGLGFVWIEDGRLVGNVSVYPADWPSDLGSAWMIANVAVHPEYRGRGIARQLMHASLDMIQTRARRAARVVAILQVDANNRVARHLYETLGFVDERAWTHWRRSASHRLPQPFPNSPYITRRRRSEWRAEFALAERIRPAALGGVGWQRPLHRSFFRPSFLRALNDNLSLRTMERLVVQTDDDQLHAVLWIESAFGASAVQLHLLVDPDYQGRADEALLNLAVRRYGARSPLTIEHPAEDNTAGDLLRRYAFYPQRTLMHMRWEVKR